MTEKRRYVKRNIDIGESLVFDQGRFSLHYLGNVAGSRSFELRQPDGGVSRRTMQPHDRIALDGGRIVIELERRHGRQARMFMDIADSVILNKPERDRPEDLSNAGNGIPPFGGCL